MGSLILSDVSLFICTHTVKNVWSAPRAILLTVSQPSRLLKHRRRCVPGRYLSLIPLRCVSLTSNGSVCPLLPLWILAIIFIKALFFHEMQNGICVYAIFNPFFRNLWVLVRLFFLFMLHNHVSLFTFWTSIILSLFMFPSVYGFSLCK